MSHSIVRWWGNSLAIRIPGEIAAAAGLGNGQRVEIETRDGDIIIHGAKPCLTLKDLFQGKTAEEWRAEYAGAYDWGPDIGREVVEE